MRTVSNDRSSLEVTIKLNPTVRSLRRSTADPAEGAKEQPGGDRGRLPRVTQVLALALQFQEMIERGEVRDYADLARLGCVSRERISQIMMLTWLAPNIQEAILNLPAARGAKCAVSETTLRAVARIPLWAEQRERWTDVLGARMPMG